MANAHDAGEMGPSLYVTNGDHDGSVHYTVATLKHASGKPLSKMVRIGSRGRTNESKRARRGARRTGRNRRKMNGKDIEVS